MKMYFILTPTPDCRGTNKGSYYLSEKLTGDRLIFECEDKSHTEKWVCLLNINPLKEGYLTQKDSGMIGFGYSK
jgi:hypothetical protein